MLHRSNSLSSELFGYVRESGSPYALVGSKVLIGLISVKSHPFYMWLINRTHDASIPMSKKKLSHLLSSYTMCGNVVGDPGYLYPMLCPQRILSWQFLRPKDLFCTKLFCWSTALHEYALQCCDYSLSLALSYCYSWIFFSIIVQMSAILGPTTKSYSEPIKLKIISPLMQNRNLYINMPWTCLQICTVLVRIVSELPC